MVRDHRENQASCYGPACGVSSNGRQTQRVKKDRCRKRARQREAERSACQEEASVPEPQNRPMCASPKRHSIHAASEPPAHTHRSGGTETLRNGLTIPPTNASASHCQPAATVSLTGLRGATSPASDCQSSVQACQRGAAPPDRRRASPRRGDRRGGHAGVESDVAIGQKVAARRTS
jgi:hypothetical protein